MSKTSTDNEEYSGDGYLPADESLFELVKFYIGEALPLLAPMLLYCAGISQLWPLWMTISNEALGAIVGVVMFNMQPKGVPSCVPLTRIRKAQHITHISELKKAA
ncbi:MAG TPA: hypothetical protein VF791_02485 [Pyrinomonadaceae bacterium]